MPGFPENGACPHLGRELQTHSARKHCSLNDLPCGCKTRVTEITGDILQRQRLCSLGLTPGAEVEICAGFPGKCKLLVRGGSLALDCEMAGRVLCES